MNDKQRAITHGETYCPACDRIFDGERCPNCNTLLMRVRLGATGSAPSMPAFPDGSARLASAPTKYPPAPASRRWPWVIVVGTVVGGGIALVMLL